MKTIIFTVILTTTALTMLVWQAGAPYQPVNLEEINYECTLSNPMPRYSHTDDMVSWCGNLYRYS